MTSMVQMFISADDFDQPLSNWDVSNVTQMSAMFSNASSFNKDISSWNVSNVIKMDNIFQYATSFNQPLNNWNTSSAITIDRIFNNAIAFNQPIDNWNVSNVTSMTESFSGASSFNQPLESWDVSAVTSMDKMFKSATMFNQPLSNWNVSSVTIFREMFQSASAFNQSLTGWDVSSSTNMTNMFYNASSLNSPIVGWSVSGNIASMFYDATSFNQDISSWNFNSSVFLNSLLTNSGINTENYDALLMRFAQLGLGNKQFNAFGLHYCNSGVRQYLINQKGWTFQGDSLGLDCVGNTISGNVRFDSNANGCDANDESVSAFLINANSNLSNYSASVASDGTFTMKVNEGGYTVNLLNLPEYYSIAPLMAEVEFEGFGNDEDINFCLTANEDVNDLNVVLLPLEEARPGFETDYQLVVQNVGTQTVTNATVNLTFDGALQTFVSANQASSATTANQLTFTIDNLLPFQSKKINLIMQLFEPPVVNGDEISHFTATVTPDTDDFTPQDNTFELSQTIVNSYDPNDKRVLQGDEIFLSEKDNYLDYIIRFQNTGTASAITVKIKDILHENLDWSTFQMISASHNYRVEIKEGNKVEFTFNNINLPHEAADEAGSNGYIAYKIKPIANVQTGDVMTGNAAIYFDYNLPIITNEATTIVVQDIEPFEASVVSENASCNGSDDGTATVTATGGAGNYTYSWFPTGGTDATATNLAAGNYIVTIADGSGNIITVELLITEPLEMNISEQPEDVVIMEGENAVFNINAANAENYQWQFSADGAEWTDAVEGGDDPTYSGVATPELVLNNVPLSFNDYSYRVRLTNGDNCHTYSEGADLNVETLVKTDDFEEHNVIIAPNPSKGEVFINFKGAEDYSNFKISVVDLNGRTLLDQEIVNKITQVDLSGFESGIYIFTLVSERSKISKQIIKQ